MFDVADLKKENHKLKRKIKLMALRHKSEMKTMSSKLKNDMWMVKYKLQQKIKHLQSKNRRHVIDDDDD